MAVRGVSGLERLELAADLEAAVGRTVHVVPLEAASEALRFRAFRDGIVLCEADRRCRVAEQARTIVTHLEWKPIRDRMVEGVLQAAREGRLLDR